MYELFLVIQFLVLFVLCVNLIHILILNTSVTLLKIHRNTWKGIIVLYCIASSTIIQYTQSKSKSKSIRCIIYFSPYQCITWKDCTLVDWAIHPMFENTGILAWLIKKYDKSALFFSLSMSIYFAYILEVKWNKNNS